MGVGSRSPSSLPSSVAALPAAASADQFPDQDPNPNPALFQQDASPYGADIATWAERATQWIWGTPLEQSPLFDPTGANCAVNQQGPVSGTSPDRRSAGDGGRHSRMHDPPPEDDLPVHIGAVVDFVAVPGHPGWDPAPGQSLYDFLAARRKVLHGHGRFAGGVARRRLNARTYSVIAMSLATCTC